VWPFAKSAKRDSSWTSHAIQDFIEKSLELEGKRNEANQEPRKSLFIFLNDSGRSVRREAEVLTHFGDLARKYLTFCLSDSRADSAAEEKVERSYVKIERILASHQHGAKIER
jgi:hypothetical protein